MQADPDFKGPIFRIEHPGTNLLILDEKYMPKGMGLKLEIN